MAEIERIETIARLIVEAESIVALTGAGISVESGVPDFRSPGGLWSKYDPFEYATYEAFIRKPEKFWYMARELMPLLENAEPNAAHYALRDLEQLGKCEAVITQNIDCLHQRAGSELVLELHGTYQTTHCLGCGCKYGYEETRNLTENLTKVPTCPQCYCNIRPDVVFYGEPLDSEVLGRSVEFAVSAEIMLVIGCSLEVYPAAALPHYAQRDGGKLIFFNVTPTVYDAMADIVCIGKAGETLPAIVDAIRALI